MINLFRKNRNNKNTISIFTYSDTGGRSENEDTVAITRPDSKIFLAVLADGLGGHGDGKKASSVAVKAIQDEFLEKIISDPDNFNVWFQSANHRVIQLQTKECKMKTTLVALQVVDDTAMWAHIGDSRLYHFVNDKLVFKTFDHSVSQMAVLRGEITEDEIRGHIDRNKLLKAIGMAETLNIDVSEKVDLKGGRHSFLLCSDGFWEYVNESEMERTLKKSYSAEEWIEKMVAILEKRKKPDNDNNSAIAIIYEGDML